MRVLICSLPVWFALSLAPPLVAQGPVPDSVAAEFQTALRDMAWWRVARLMHPQALQAFRARLDLMLEADEGGRTREAIFGATEAAEYGAVPPEAVFVRVIEVMGAEMPGLIHALVVREAMRGLLLRYRRPPPDR